MFAKRILSKAILNHLQRDANCADSAANHVDLRVCMHYGVPSTASILAFDPVQHLLSIGTQDGRIKVIGGDGIEGLFLLPEQVPVKFLEFLRNQGVLVSVTIDNSIQVWNLENRSLASCHHCESNIRAFSVINSSNFIYLGDEHGSLSVLEFDADTGKIVQLPYHGSATYISDPQRILIAQINKSLSYFALVNKCSLNSLLPCNFEANLNKTISCDGKKIALAKGSELAFISLAAGGVARMAEALPSLHDPVVAAADAVIGISSSQKKRQGSTSRAVKGIVKGFKSAKPVERTCPTLLKPDDTQLRAFFSKSSFTGRLHEGVKNVKNTDQSISTSDQEVDLNIDVIEIDDFTHSPT